MQTLHMVAPKPSGFTSTKPGKAAVIERTKNLVHNAGFIIIAPIEGVKKENIDILRNMLPETTKAHVVKNALMRIAVRHTQFECLIPFLKHESMYFFIAEGEQKKSFQAFKKWQDEVKRTEPEFNARVCVLEGTVYKEQDVETAVNLPTRKELMTQIAVAIRMIPTRLATSLNAIPTKVAIAINAVKEKQEKEAATAGAASPDPVVAAAAT